MEFLKTILLLEDDKNLNRGITLKLEKEGYRVLSAFGVTEAMDFFRKFQIQLIISDITLEDGSGLEFCREIRKLNDVYIIFLTALDQEIDIINGYDIGADDYITKPFSLMVLLSKIQALLRRLDHQKKTFLRSGEISVSYLEMKAYKNQEPLLLSKKELQLMIFLMEHAKQIVSKEQILENIWDVDGQFVDENTVPVNISRLRGKVGADCIQNVRGIGYIWTKGSIKE